MTGPAITVNVVTSRADHWSFCKFPYDLYANDPHWVPPLKHAERRRWSQSHNASLRYRWVRRFLARQGGEVVGRVAAVVDTEFNDRWEDRAGFFGFFESTNNSDVATALLRCAEECLVDRGMKSILGPINLTTNDEVGLLVEGFDSPPMILSPYNPKYYEELLRHCGYRARVDYYAYAWDATKPPSPRAQRLLRAMSRQGSAAAEAKPVRLRPADPKQWGRENETLLALYNASFSGLWGFVPFTPAEYQQKAREFRSFYDPGLVLFAEVAGRPVGFGLALPNINEVLGLARGRLLPFGWLRLGLAMKRIRSGRFVLIGVLPEYAGRGIAVSIAGAMVEAAARLGYQGGELSLVQQTNTAVQNVIRAFGAGRSKVYRLFQKGLVA